MRGHILILGSERHRNPYSLLKRPGALAPWHRWELERPIVAVQLAPERLVIGVSQTGAALAACVIHKPAKPSILLSFLE